MSVVCKRRLNVARRERPAREPDALDTPADRKVRARGIFLGRRSWVIVARSKRALLTLSLQSNIAQRRRCRQVIVNNRPAAQRQVYQSARASAGLWLPCAARPVGLPCGSASRGSLWCAICGQWPHAPRAFAVVYTSAWRRLRSSPSQERSDGTERAWCILPAWHSVVSNRAGGGPEGRRGAQRRRRIPCGTEADGCCDVVAASLRQCERMIG